MPNPEIDNRPLVTAYRPAEAPAPPAPPVASPTEVHQPRPPEAAPAPSPSYDDLSVLAGIRVAILDARRARQEKKADEALSYAESGAGAIDAVREGSTPSLASRPVTPKEVRRYEKAERHKRKAMRAGFDRIGEAQTHGSAPGTRAPLYERGMAPPGKEFRESDIGTQRQLDRLERGSDGRPIGGNLADQVDQARYSRSERKGEMRSRKRWIRAVGRQEKHNKAIADLVPGGADADKAREHISKAAELEARIAKIARKDRRKRSSRR